MIILGKFPVRLRKTGRHVLPIKTNNNNHMKIIPIILFLFICPVSSYSQVGASFCGPYNVSAPISLDGVNNKTISELEISNPYGNCIKLTNCHNIIIEKCKLGSSLGNGIDLYNCTGITVLDCRMDSVATGIYANTCAGISVTNIEVTNVQGPMPRGQMVQFNKVSGAGNRVNYNVVENELGESGQEDAINMYKTNGTALDPIQIIGNWIRGGGPSKSGGGILIGDAGGSNYTVQDNILVNPGQYGIGVASGTHVRVLNNKIYAAQKDFTNVGIYVWNQYNSDCNSNTVRGNEVNWTNNSGNSNGAWNGSNCGEINGWSNNNWFADINDTILPEQITLDYTILSVSETSNYNIPVYPNPTTGKVYFSSQYINESYTVYSLVGTIVKSEKIEVQNIDLSDLTSGMYILRIERKNTGKAEVLKLIKE
jgi:hypothetical protein